MVSPATSLADLKWCGVVGLASEWLASGFNGSVRHPRLFDHRLLSFDVTNTASYGVREISWASEHRTSLIERESLQKRRSVSRSGTE